MRCERGLGSPAVEYNTALTIRCPNISFLFSFLEIRRGYFQ